MKLSYKYRLYPNRRQNEALGEMLYWFCQLYNAGLQQRIEAYRRRAVSLTYKTQADELKLLRTEVPELGNYSFSAEQQVLRRLNKTFTAFFGRVKRGAKAGFPRFKASARFHAADFRFGDGLTMKSGHRLSILGVSGLVKVKWHRDWPKDATCGSAIITRQAGKWSVVFQLDVPDVHSVVGPETVGVDAGLSALVATSDGALVERPRWTKTAAKGLRKRQRAVSRSRKPNLRSKRRKKAKERLAAYSRRVANRRADYLHKLAASIVARYDRIAVEELNIQGLARSMLAKDVLDAAWGQLMSLIAYKAERAGKLMVKVDPRGTSQECPCCGARVEKTLADRVHRCPDCGLVEDRDVAAANVVEFRAFGHNRVRPGSGLRTPSRRGAAELVREAVGF
ncbi:transposase [Azospirillum sp. A1-3]|uniref:RNA-guided endonuclease InsQ/TnpB family protein n=1 Tax=Azospirillum sp. A1-3 TaxID=185874 RepID=UPI0020775C3B|nr:transposase [Azospirillum sp. A1-3]MCM8738723.1 transposase [Azospirillum sp. A1-3]